MNKLIIILSALVMGFSVQAKQIDSAKSEIKWTGKKVTGKHYGTIPVEKSDIKMKDGKVSSGEIVMSIKGLDVTDLSGKYKKKFLDHMKSADFFEVKKWPTAKLVVKSVKGNKAMGDLTIKGKTNPVTFNFNKKGEFYVGQLKFDRTKFGMIYGSGDFVKNLGDKMIYNDVTLDFKVALK